MICRRVKEDGNRWNVVWFGSYGKNLDGTAKFFSSTSKHDNYSEQQESVKDSLIQRLSIIQEELWYNIEYGLPLLNNSPKLAIDTTVAGIVADHPDVESIISFESEVFNHHYSARMKIQTTFGELSLSI